MPAGAGGLRRARPFGEHSNDRHQEAKEHNLFHVPPSGRWCFRCECLGRADHGDPLGHRCDRPDQANRDHDGDTDPYAHLHPLLRRVELGEIGLPYFSAPQCEVVHTVDRKLPHPRGAAASVCVRGAGRCACGVYGGDRGTGLGCPPGREAWGREV
jgi:hypothetical protein